jgi:membrane protease YdiL (CAAX protease family)
MNILLGANVSAAPALSLAGILELLFLGGLWEEPGWTGYALPKLQEKFTGRRNQTALVILVLGTFRAIWHIPLFLYGHIPWYDVVILAFAMQALITWLYNRSGGSTLTAMTFHLMSNLAGLAMLFTFTGVERTRYQLLFIGVASVIALALHFFTSRDRSSSGQTTWRPGDDG